MNHKHTYDRPTETEAQLAAVGSRILATCTGSGETAQLRLIEDNTDITVPVSAVKMLAEILNQMALGNAISIVPIHMELTTQEVADMLNVSRPFLIKNILDTGELAFHRVGTRRKITFKDVMAYKHAKAIETDSILADLAAQSQEMGIVDR